MVSLIYVTHIAVIDQDVEAVPLAPHEDHEGEWVSHVHRLGHPLAGGAVALPDLHMARRRRQCEVNRVLRVDPICFNMHIGRDMNGPFSISFLCFQHGRLHKSWCESIHTKPLKWCYTKVLCRNLITCLEF